MLRNLVALALMVIGAVYAVQGPYHALLFYLWFAYFRPDVWAWSDLFGQFNLSMIVGIYIAAATLLTRQRLRFDSHVLVMLLFGLHALASALTSTNPELAMIAWLEIAKRLVIAYLIAVLVTDRTRFRLVLWVVGLSLALESAKQGWGELILRPGLANDNPMTFLGDRNAVAMGMLMLVPILAVLAKTADRRWVRFGFVFLLVGVIYRAVSTYSRGGAISAVVLAGFYWLRSKRKGASLVILLVCGVLVAGVMPDAFWDRMQTTLTYEEVGEASALGRLHFWTVAAQMANDRPLLGVGPGAYRTEYDRYDTSYGAYGRRRVAHSTWFSVLAEHGYVGELLYAAFLLLAFANTRRVRQLVRKGGAPSELELYAAMLEAGLLVFMTGSAFLSLPEMEFPYHYVGLSMALRGIALEEWQGR